MRLGVAHVAPGYNQSASTLTDGADVIAGIGAESIKLFASPDFTTKYPGQVWGSVPTTLAELFATAPFASTFARSEFSRYFLGTWTFANNVFDSWKGGVTRAMLQAEYDELKAACAYLLSTFSGKDFVIQNTECDWAMVNSNNQPVFDPTNQVSQSVIDSAVAFFGVRIKAVADARREVASSSRVFSCIETNRVLDNMPRVHSHVLPRIQPDFVSWTAYEAINDWTLAGATQESVENSIRVKIASVVQRIRRAISATQGVRGARIPIVIGEFGWPEAHPLFSQGFDAGAFADTLIDTAEQLGIWQCNFWQLWDNEVYTDPPPTHPRRQAIYDENGDTTAQGQVVLDLLDL